MTSIDETLDTINQLKAQRKNIERENKNRRLYIHRAKKAMEAITKQAQMDLDVELLAIIKYEQEIELATQEYFAAGEKLKKLLG